MVTVAPYGSWRSPIAPESLTEGSVGIGQVAVDGDDLYWNESRPADAGRLVVVRRTPDGATRDVVPAGFSARTRVHEYGGFSYVVRDGVVWFTNFADQRVYRIEPGGDPVAVSPQPEVPSGMRFADMALARDGTWLIGVRETHDGSVVNDIAGVPADGSAKPVTLVAGHDFFAAPRVSPDGTQLAWLSWDFPNMPWDGTELRVAPLHPDMTLGPARVVAGGPAESVSQPRWSPDGRLHFVSDRTGWWNLYVDDGEGGRPLAPKDAEFGGPDWTFGQSTYAFTPDGTLVAGWHEQGRSHLAMLDRDGLLRDIRVPYTTVVSVTGSAGSVVVSGASGTEFAGLIRVGISVGRVEVIKRTRESTLDAGFVSVAEPIEFPTGGGLRAHAYLYRPRNPDFEAPAGEKPPLIVISHGGPTGNTSATLDIAVQYWTTRGFAVVDVDYGGSTGYGRVYRERLRSKWGIVDVEDCVNAARWLAEQGEVDGEKMVIRGGSAGGYTTLAALAFTDVFAAGASHFGVADASALATDTHKFESRYLDNLIGPWPDAEAVYRERSPIHHVDGFNCPLILFQGLEDRVFPPNQAEMMRDALQARGIAVEYHAYEGEQHGFRKAETIIDVAKAELAFYGRVLGFAPPGDQLDHS